MPGDFIFPLSKDTSDPNSYRPISLLSNMDKLFERIILELLDYTYLEHERRNNIIIPEQFGFRTEHSTVQQILRITENATLGFNTNRNTGMVLLDPEKAFDSVWHDGLLYKLIKTKTPNRILGIIDSYLQNRKFFVYVNGKCSSTIDIPAGVPQGSILSPHLFSLFINDIPRPANCHLAMFADDIAIFCDKPWKNIKSLRNTLIRALESIAKFFKDWKIKLNHTKTEFVIFTQSRKMIKKLLQSTPTFEGKLHLEEMCNLSWI